MSRVQRIRPQFVEEVPQVLDEGVLYISIEFGTVVHSCCCGCGREVVTPLHPTRWALTWDGDTASLNPSVGSWALPCRSHYVIRRNAVRWARQWSEEDVAAGRRRDQALSDSYFDPSPVVTESETVEGEDAPVRGADAEAASSAGTRRGWNRWLFWIQR